MNQVTNSGSAALAGKVAIITGASRGIGRATAQIFVTDGSSVVLAARDEVALSANVQAIEAAGGRTLAVPIDVADEASEVANVPFEQIDVATWESVLGTNLRGTFLFCREVIRAMIPAGGGVFVHLFFVSPDAAPLHGTNLEIYSKCMMMLGSATGVCHDNQ